MKKIIAGVGAVIVVLALVYLISPFINISIGQKDVSDQQWDKDFAFLESKLPESHIDPFTKISQKDWEAKVEALKKTPDKPVALLEMVAAINDGHTYVVNYIDGNSLVFPFQIAKLADGFFIVNTDDAHRQLLGQKVVSLNGQAIEEIYEKFRPFIPYDNENRFKAEFERYSNDQRLLHHLKVCTDTELVLKTSEGNHPLDAKKNSEMHMIRQTPDEAFQVKRLSPETVVLKIYHHPPLMNIPATFEQALADDAQIKNVIIDLQDDVGGTYYPGNKLEKILSNRINRYPSTKLYTVIGRKTFSSGVLQAFSLKDEYHALLVGEDTGGALDGFGDVRTFTLPESKMSIMYSTKRFQLTNDNRNTLSPDIPLTIDHALYLDDSGKIYDLLLKA